MWSKLSICEQLGNVGSEVGRARNWHEKGDFFHRDKALGRAFELLDLTITDIRWIGPRLKELCRVREVLADAFYGNGEYKTTTEDMEKYFYQYALAARKDK